MGVIREFGGSDRFDIGILGFYDFYLVFIIAPAFSKVRYRGSTFRTSVRPSFHNLRGV